MKELVGAGEGPVLPTDTLRWGLQDEEALARHLCHDLGAEALGHQGLVAYQQTARLYHALRYNLEVLRQQAAQVYDLAGNVCNLSHLVRCSLQDLGSPDGGN